MWALKKHKRINKTKQKHTHRTHHRPVLPGEERACRLVTAALGSRGEWRLWLRSNKEAEMWGAGSWNRAGNRHEKEKVQKVEADPR